MKMWRMILSGTNDAFFNMALDEALLISCQKGFSPPVLRLYQWKPPAVSIGYFQSAGKTVDIQKCRKNGIDVIRRITGGRAVLHEDEITYSVCASISRFPVLGKTVTETYRKLGEALWESLRFLGVEGEWVKPSTESQHSPASTVWSKPCFISSSRYELMVSGKKLIGSAQRRFYSPSTKPEEHSFIQHGSILTGKGKFNLADFLPDAKLTDRVKSDLLERSTDLQMVLGERVTAEKIAHAVKGGFKKTFGCLLEDSKVSENELQTAWTLSREKFGHDRWNLRI
jgi:lipoate-protein ligase A